MRVLPFVAIIFLCTPAWSESLTKAELFDLYSRTVNQVTIAQRLDQLFTNLPAGAFKDQARATLMQDLLDAVSVQLGLANTRIQSFQDRATANGESITELVITPLLEQQQNINETTLP